MLRGFRYVITPSLMACVINAVRSQGIMAGDAPYSLIGRCFPPAICDVHMRTYWYKLQHPIKSCVSQAALPKTICDTSTKKHQSTCWSTCRGQLGNTLNEALWEKRINSRTEVEQTRQR